MMIIVNWVILVIAGKFMILVNLVNQMVLVIIVILGNLVVLVNLVILLKLVIVLVWCGDCVGDSEIFW